MHKSELSAQEAATLVAKFKKSSFNHIRIKLITDLKGLSDPLFEPAYDHAKAVCSSIRNWIKDESATATPSQIASKLYSWLTNARKDEGYADKTRIFGTDLIAIINGFTTGCLEAMEKRELNAISIDSESPSNAASTVHDNVDVGELKKQIDDLSKLLEDEKAKVQIHLKQIEDAKLANDRDKERTTIAHEREKELLQRQLDATKQTHEREKEKLTSAHDREKDTLAHQHAEVQRQHEREKEKLAQQTEEAKREIEREKQDKEAIIRREREKSSAQQADIDRLQHEVGELSKVKELSIAVKLELEAEKSKSKLAEANILSLTARAEKAEAEQKQLMDKALLTTSEIATLKAQLEAAKKQVEDLSRARDELKQELTETREVLNQARTQKEEIAVAKGQVDGELKATKETKDDLIQRGERTLQALALTQQKAKQQETHLLEAGKVINTLTHRVAESVPEEQRVTVLEESLADASEAGIAALGLERTTILKQATGKKANAGAQKAPGQLGMFKAAAPASANGAPKKVATKKELSPAEALVEAKQKCLLSGMSEIRFNAIEGIAKFIAKHLANEKGVLKANAHQDLFSKLVQATKTIAGPESTPIATVYQSLVDSKPDDKDPSFNDYNEMLISLAVDEPKGENLQNKSIFFNLTNHVFGKTYFIKELNTHFGTIYQQLNVKKADTTASASGPLLDKTGIENAQKDTSFIKM